MASISIGDLSKMLSQYVASQSKPQYPGLLEPGNIDLNTRPVVKNPDGSYSTVRSTSFNIDGREVLVPTVTDDGKIVSPQEALALYQRTGKHLGIFDNPENATSYAEGLHTQQARQYAPPVDPDVPNLSRQVGVAPEAGQRYRNFMQGKG